MEQQKYFADLERLGHGESIVGLERTSWASSRRSYNSFFGW